MTKWLVRLEGVNFGATIFDTRDLSTVRGASLALLRMHEPAAAALKAEFGDDRVEMVFSGASLAAFHVVADGALEAVATKVRAAIEECFAAGGKTGISAVLPYLTVVVDTVAIDTKLSAKDQVETALAAAEARNHARQFRSWTVDRIPLDRAAVDADPFDRIRPADVDVILPRGKILDAKEVATTPSGERRILSASVAARRDYGRRQRQQFYVDELGRERARELLGDGDIGFTQSIEDMIVEVFQPGLPLSLRNKIAVVYADGNGFGKAKAVTGTVKFAEELSKMRRSLLEKLLGWMVGGAKSDVANLFAILNEKEHRVGLRFETLLWGGDELMFVVPSWLAFPLTKRFFAATKGWKIGGVALTHAVGVAIADRKAPIRQLRDIAHAAADGAKEAGLRSVDTVTFDIFESSAPPDVDLVGGRSRTFGAGADLARLLALPGDRMEAIDDAMARLVHGDGTQEGFPRSQIYAALRACRRAPDPMGLLGMPAAKAVEEHFDKLRHRAGGESRVATLNAHLLPTVPGISLRPKPLDLALIALLWDYVRPLDRPLDQPRADTGKETV
jgi:hypothetical protein